MYSRQIPQTAWKWRCSEFETYSSCLLMNLLHLLGTCAFPPHFPNDGTAARVPASTLHALLAFSNLLMCQILLLFTATVRVPPTRADHTNFSCSLRSRDEGGFFSPRLAWKHSGNEQGLNCWQRAHPILQGWRCAYPTENPWGCCPHPCYEYTCCYTGQLLQSHIWHKYL